MLRGVVDAHVQEMLIVQLPIPRKSPQSPLQQISKLLKVIDAEKQMSFFRTLYVQMYSLEYL
jgi:hypothetical protein